MEYLHSMIRVSDLEQTVEFFCKKLGFTELSRADHEKGRYTLVFLAAPGDAEAARRNKAPMVELTHNWDEKGYAGGRNFGHLAYRVEDIYGLCDRLMKGGVVINRPPRGRAYGLHKDTRRHLDRAASERRCTVPERALGLDAEHRNLVTPP
jgi:lactoylglutathione lyase